MASQSAKNTRTPESRSAKAQLPSSSPYPHTSSYSPSIISSVARMMPSLIESRQQYTFSNLDSVAESFKLIAKKSTLLLHGNKLCQLERTFGRFLNEKLAVLFYRWSVRVAAAAVADALHSAGNCKTLCRVSSLPCLVCLYRFLLSILHLCLFGLASVSTTPARASSVALLAARQILRLPLALSVLDPSSIRIHHDPFYHVMCLFDIVVFVSYFLFPSSSVLRWIPFCVLRLSSSQCSPVPSLLSPVFLTPPALSFLLQALLSPLSSLQLSTALTPRCSALLSSSRSFSPLLTVLL